MVYLYIAIGSAIGGLSRYWCNNLFTSYFSSQPYQATLIVNIIGSFIIGIFAACINPEGISPNNSTMKYLGIVGFCGGFTTFSTFSLQTLELLRSGEMLKVGANISLSVIVCLIAVWAGFFLGTLIKKN